MFGPGGAIRAFRTIVAGSALAALMAATSAVLVPTAAGATVTRKPQSPDAWTEKFCTGFVGWQASALDARDAAFPIVRTPPTDRPGVKTAASGLDAALKPPTKAIDAVAENLVRRHPRGKHGAELGGALATDVGKLAHAYTTARERAAALKSTTPTQFAKQAPRVLTKLDAGLEKAERPITKLNRRIANSSIGDPLRTTPACLRLGLEWSAISANVPTLPPPAIDPAAPGADDVTAPAVILPGHYRPSPEIAALAARTTMTGLGREFFYASAPAVETGVVFKSHCPSPEASTQTILGCYNDHSIFVLNVTRPELVTVVDVTAAHEMLHAVYEDMSAAQHAVIDPQLSAFYDASPDVHLHQIVPIYEQRTPQNRASELHSLIGSQVGGLTPQLDAYYAQYFKDRNVVVNAYNVYISVFDNLVNQLHDLQAQLDDLHGQIDNLRAQANSAGAQADSLSAQIQSLRAQGRIAESNVLVPGQNSAADRANGLAHQANALIGQYNGIVAQANDVVAQLGGLDAALRPLG